MQLLTFRFSLSFKKNKKRKAVAGSLEICYGCQACCCLSLCQIPYAKEICTQAQGIAVRDTHCPPGRRRPSPRGWEGESWGERGWEKQGMESQNGLGWE